MTHTVKSIRVYAVVEQVIEPPVNLDELRRDLKAGKFRGEIHVNSSQGGVTNVVTRERLPLTMAELDALLARR